MTVALTVQFHAFRDGSVERMSYKGYILSIFYLGHI